ncbi:sensor histidine kinase, partial [Flavobacterium sp.]
TIASIIVEKESHNLSERGRDYFRRMREAAQRMQALINDLLAYSRSRAAGQKFKHTDLSVIISQVVSDIAGDIKDKNAVVEIGMTYSLDIVPFQFRQLLYNLISNSLKFSDPHRSPVIKISCSTAKGDHFGAL